MAGDLDRPAHGRHKAAALAPDRVSRRCPVRNLNTREAKAAFADYWIGVWAEDFDYAWRMGDQPFCIVEQDHLYADRRRVGPGAPGDADDMVDRRRTSLLPNFFKIGPGGPSRDPPSLSGPTTMRSPTPQSF